jgi:hypothetical protein
MNKFLINNLMKNTITILLSLVFVYNTVLFLAVHPFLSIYYKHLGNQRAENPSKVEKIETLVINKEDILEGKIDFMWINSHEFKYNGDMYDIIKKGENDNQLFLYCSIDAEEMNLEEGFKKRVHKNSSEGKNFPTIKYIISSLFSGLIQYEQFSNALEYECSLNFKRNDFYQSPLLNIPSPPPRLA